jgi:hypothetical protein
MELQDLDPKMRMMLSAKPLRNEAVKWEEEDGKIVLVYPKNFTRFERFLHRRVGGPSDIRRPLDEKGTLIWKMCDGEHNIHEICTDLYKEFREDIEPVLRRVWGFLEILHNLNLITFEVQDKEENVDEDKEDEEGEEEKGDEDDKGKE